MVKPGLSARPLAGLGQTAQPMTPPFQSDRPGNPPTPVGNPPTHGHKVCFGGREPGSPALLEKDRTFLLLLLPSPEVRRHRAAGGDGPWSHRARLPGLAAAAQTPPQSPAPGVFPMMSSLAPTGPGADDS